MTWLEYRSALCRQVECPMCGAQPGQACQSPASVRRGKKPTGMAHRARQDLAQRYGRVLLLIAGLDGKPFDEAVLAAEDAHKKRRRVPRSLIG